MEDLHAEVWLPQRRLEDEGPPPEPGTMSWLDHHLVRYGAMLVAAAGPLLHLPPLTTVTAMALLHRLYSVSAYTDIEVWFAAPAALLAASKMQPESPPADLPDVVQVMHHLLQACVTGDKESPHSLDLFCQKFRKLGSRVAHAERELLRASGFVPVVVLPHKFILNMLNMLDLMPGKVEAEPGPSSVPPLPDRVAANDAAAAALRSDLASNAIRVANDAHLTRVCLCLAPHEIAAGAVAYACVEASIALPLEWSLLFDVKPKVVDAFGSWMDRLYMLPPPVYENVADSKEIEFRTLHAFYHES
ncbi:cyclin-L1 [Thecamonas trahens ATCC 50062]|uniref:Cyclin-L1 n=1 Tax=Thecamonas trahens ATCC 50062 TaxID=461836 RepID=A0A0L0D1K3_THETB|nr:cyclin-L1 [Thecamonas trahens ATCC 50062]KNC46122.1 cyclin-L1 [Thecamonas trahens ATCC 50062]|eukprot:XP_013763099.1 cyclin-L1 [Thecamonas trahens ATCC 50062]